MHAHIVNGLRGVTAALVLATLFSPLPAEAKALYVNSSTGNDATTYAANGPSAPWRTIGRAAWGSVERNAPNTSEAARAGDVVNIAGGTYVTVGNLTGGGGGRQDVAYNPANSGAAGNPIRFLCTGVCILTFSGGAGPMIGAMERNYIEWSGFTISETTAPSRSDTGPVTFFRVTGGAIENSILTGNPNWTARVGDNYNGVRLEDATGVRIAGNLIRDYGGQTGDRNHSCVTTYRSYPVLIENNEIVNCGSGIYLKGTSPNSVIQTGRVRFNVFRSSRFAMHVLQQPMTSSLPLLIYQNIFVGNREAALWINQFDNGQYDAKWVRFFNNTLVDNTSAMATYNGSVFPAGANLLFWNNVVAGSGHRIRQDTTDAVVNNRKDRLDFDYNVYATGHFEVGGQDRTFAYIQGLGQDLNSLVVDPGLGADYRLSANSPARTAGRALYGVGGPAGSVIPAGAYILGSETIGRAGGAPPPPPTPPGPAAPSAPTGLRIISGSE